MKKTLLLFAAFLGVCLSGAEIIYKNKVALNFESSHAVRGNSFVLGSRGTQIYKFHIE